MGARTAAPNAVAITVLLLAVCLPASAAPARIRLGAGQPEAYAWQADESWPGGSLADARLDRPVRFWRAGLSLPEVFAGVEEQTGVAISIWPPSDPAARMRVTLYLNREQPPTLREVMAQLPWVTRYGFACTEGPERRYYLLGTGEVTDVEARLAAREAERVAAEREREAAARRGLLSHLERYRAALGLSREELVARYCGQDNALLVTMLDPGRRARFRVLCSLSPEQLATLVDQGMLILTLSGSDLAQRGGLPEGDDGMEWTVAFRIDGGEVSLGGGRGGSDRAGIWADFTPIWGDRPAVRGGGWWPPGTGPVVRRGMGPGGEVFALDLPLVGDGSGVRPGVDVEVRRLLGEIADDASAQELLRQASERETEELNQRREREQRDRMRAAPQLSEEVAHRLEQITITWQWNTNALGPLWRIQEAVAAATGLSVISDCFTWEDRAGADPRALLPQAEARLNAYFREMGAFEQAHPEEWSKLAESGELAKRFPSPAFEVSARDWLTALCYPDMATLTALPSGPVHIAGAEGWEWGSAGSLLRFRTAFPEVWGGAMLPGPVGQAIEEAIQPYLKMAEEGTLPKEVPFPLDLRTQAWIVSQLDGVQLRVGPELAHDDPSTAAGQLHSSLAQHIVVHLSAVDYVLRFLATLREDQWETLRRDGLNAWDDLTPEQRADPFIAAWVENAAEPEAKAAILRQVRFRLLTVPGKSQPRLGVRGPEGMRVPSLATVVVQASGGGDAHRSAQGGEVFFDFSAPLQTGMTLPPPLALSRRE